jgi:ABC-2 type transport system permease protein
MHSVWIIARHEFITGVRRPSFIIMTLLIPLLGAVGLAVAAFAGGQASSFLASQFGPNIGKVGIVDQSTVFTPILPDYQKRFVAEDSVAEGKSALSGGDIDLLVVFGADYEQTGKVIIYSLEDNLVISSIDDSGLLENFITDHLLRDTTDKTLLARLHEPITEADKLGLDDKPISKEGQTNFFIDFLLPYFFAIFLIISIFSSSGFLLQGVSQEKTSRVIEIILSSVTAWELLIGKVIGLGLLGVTRVAIWIGSGIVLGQGAVSLLDMSLPTGLRPEIFILSGVYYLLGFLLFAILMGTSGALGATQQEANQIAGIFTMVAAFPTWIGGFLFANPNAPVARILSWFPLTAPTMMLLRMPLGTVPIEDTIGSIVLLVISVPIVTWFGSKLFRYGLLMYGKRPTFRQMIQIIRQA